MFYVTYVVYNMYYGYIVSNNTIKTQPLPKVIIRVMYFIREYLTSITCSKVILHIQKFHIK